MKVLKLAGLSLILMFVTVAAAPSKPYLLSPINGRLVTDYTPVLKWQRSTGGTGGLDHYEIQLALDSSFNIVTLVDSDSGVLPSGFSTETWTPGPTLNPSTTYYWRVRSVSGSAEKSAWAGANFRTAVEQPIVLDPLNGDIGNSAAHPTSLCTNDNPNLLGLRPTFKWTPVLNAQSYTFQIANNYSFTSPLVNVSLSNTLTEYKPVALPANRLLYWRIRANHSTYGPGAWSVPQFFCTPNPPSIPVPMQPLNGILTNDHSPRLDFNKVSVPGGPTYFGNYEIEIATRSDFDPLLSFFYLIDDGSLGTFSDIDGPCGGWVGPCYDVDDLSPLPAAHTYYWRVRAYNTDGEYSVWSSRLSLRTTVDPPILLDPPDHGAVLTPRPVFDWADTFRATAYRIKIYTGSRLIIDDNVWGNTHSQYTPSWNLPGGQTIRWRVYSLNSGYGPSLSSDLWAFTSANPPSRPTLIYPANTQLIRDYSPTFWWSISAVPTHPVPVPAWSNYEIQITKGTFGAPDISDTVMNQLDPQYTPGSDLDPGVTYRWRVRACNVAAECSFWSIVHSFNTAVEPPVLANPADGTMDTNPRPIFDWDPVPGATSYFIRITKNASCINPIFAAYLPNYDTDFQPGSNMAIGVYYWCVLARAPNYGPSAWSDIWSYERTP
jgi:hypothetical protein